MSLHPLITLPRVVFLLAVLLLLRAPARADSPLPWQLRLGAWHFHDTNLLSDAGIAPKVAQGQILAPSFETNALRLLGETGLVRYPVISTNGVTNLTLRAGTVRFWYRPQWTSVPYWGTGPGVDARLIEVGRWTNDASYGWWGIHLNPEGTELYFGGQSKGFSAYYAYAPVAWFSNEWHQVAISYSPSNSFLYLDGQLAMSGFGVTRYPGSIAQEETGLAVGGDNTGHNLMQGDLDRLETFNYPLSAAVIAADFAEIYVPPTNGPSGGIGGFPAGGGGGSTNLPPSVTGTPKFLTAATETNLWLEMMPSNRVAWLVVHNTRGGTNYQILGRARLGSGHWRVLQNLSGTAGTNCTVTTVPIDQLPEQYYVAGLSEDSDGDGLADAYELLSCQTDPNQPDTGNTGVPDGYKDSDGDGWTNLEEMRRGTNPLVFNTPAAVTGVSVRVSGANEVITWAPARGPVLGYSISDRYGNVLGTVGSNVFTFMGATNSVTGNPNYIQAGYVCEALYAGGDSELSEVVNIWSPELTVEGQMVRGTNEQKHLCIRTWPEGVTAVRVTTFEGSYSDLAKTNFQNGVCLLTGFNDAQLRWLQGMSADGALGSPTYLVSSLEGWPDFFAHSFVDLRPILAQNLRFLLRAATVTRSFSYAAYDTGSDLYPRWLRSTGSGQYEYAGFRWHNSEWPYATTLFHPDRPVEENYLWRNLAFAQNLFTSNGVFLTGTRPVGGLLGGDREIISPLFRYDGSNTAPQLSHDQTEWIYYTQLSGLTNAFNDAALWEAGLTEQYLDTVLNWTLPPGVTNRFGLPVDSAKLVKSTLPGVQHYQIAAGQSADVIGYGAKIFLNTRPPVFGAASHYYSRRVVDLETGDSYFSPPIPSEPDFSPTNTTPILITGVGESIYLSGWAKKRITNGDTNKFAYLEQFFDQAFKADTNGQATTNQAGILSEYGEFFPVEPGRVILTTKPDIETGEVGQATVQVIHLGVDANHDGVMDRTFGGPDTTSTARPFRFWLNNDSDAGGADENKPGSPNHADTRINGERDLEDLARLWISGVPTLPAGYTARLSWSGSGTIRLFSAIEADGGIGYLTNTGVAYSQSFSSQNGSGVWTGQGAAVATLSASSDYEFPANTFSNGFRRHFLFEGVAAGKGTLWLTIERDGLILAQSPVSMELNDIKDMYEQAHVEGINTGFPANYSLAESPRFKVDAPLGTGAAKAKQLIVFVHGWRMDHWEYESFSESMFKRLYWQGYEGDFASVRWPTLSRESSGDVAQYFTYNRSEFIAFKSGTAVSAYLNNLRQRFPDHTINVASHSMGGIVMMQALKEQLAANAQAIDNYVLMQVAVTAHCYDSTLPNYSFLTAEEASHPTPDTYRAYPGTINNAIRGQMVNFYNTNDFALATGTLPVIGGVSWEANAKNYKPDTGYSWDGTNAFYFVGPTLQHLVTNTFQRMSFVARPRAEAVGARPGVTGVIQGGQVDLTQLSNLLGDRSEHSAQFNWNIHRLNLFYRTLGVRLGVLSAE